MKNRTVLKFVKATEYIAEFFCIVLILDTKWAINNSNSHFIDSCWMNFFVIYILVTFIWKIIMRIFFKERHLKDKEIDSISLGLIVGLVLWILVLLLFYIIIGKITINGGLLKDILIYRLK